ncbi:M56 family metallopeptidase [Arenimonas aestuarii]
MSALDGLLSWLLTLALHATVLLSLAWGLQRLGALRHPGWRELAWRGALFGALLSSVLATAAPALPTMGGWGGTQEAPAASLAPATDKRPDPRQALRATLPGESGLPRVLVPRESTAPNSAPRPSETSFPPAPWRLPGPTAALLVLAWVLGGAPVALRLLRQAWSLMRWTRRQPGTVPRPGSRLPALAADLGQALELKQLPRLRLLEGLASPMLLPGRRLLLPAWVDELSPAQQRALLAHELAHLQRHDPAWRLAQRLAVLPLYFHPLAWLALRRLEALAEDACDERAAALCGSGRPLAECLAACLARGKAPQTITPTLAVAMAAEPGPVVRRVRNLLEETPMPRPIPASLRRTAVAVGLAAALALPGLAITSVANPAHAEGLFSGLFTGTSVTNSNGRDHYLHRNGRTGERQELTLRGDIQFTAAEDDVTRMANDAEFELSVKRDGVERSLRILPAQGGMTRDYRVDGRKQAFDAQARAWLATALPDVLRESGFKAEERARRILAQGGLEALFTEIDRIRGDHSRGRYLQILFSQAPLDDAGFARALELAGKIGSDHALRRVLEAGFGNMGLTDAAQTQLLGLASKIGSDYEQSQLLIALVEKQSIQGDLLIAWREVLAGIGSDYEQRKVLSALLARSEPESTRMALESAQSVGSDYEARKILEQAVPMARDDAGARDAWFALLAGVGSDYEQRQALGALIAGGAVDASLAGAVLDSLEEIGSDHETTQVLRVLAAVMPADPELIARYRAVARRLSDHERGQAERALDRFAVAGVDQSGT